MQKISIIIYSIICTVLLVSCGADQAMKKGDKFYALGEYFDAAAQYRKAYTHTSNKQREQKGQRAMKMAECYRRIHFTAKPSPPIRMPSATSRMTRSHTSTWDSC